MTRSTTGRVDEVLWQRDTWTPSNSTSLAPPLTSQAAFLLPEDDRARCAAPGCTAKVKFWKKSARPVFEGRWACSPGCALELVQDSVRRQWSNSSSSVPDSVSHRHRIPLGLVLLDRGLITHFQLQQALEAQKAAGHSRIGHWLETSCGVSSETITRAMAAQWNRPVLSSQGFVAHRMTAVMPASLRRASRMLPLRVAANKILYVAFVDEVDAAAVRALELMSGLTVESGLLAHGDFAESEAKLETAPATTCSEVSIDGTSHLCDHVVQTLQRHHPVASRLVPVRSGFWLRLWLERGACSAQGTLPTSSDDIVDVLYSR